VYESDPAASVGYQPRRFSSLGYEQALALAGPLIQPKAVHFLNVSNAPRKWPRWALPMSRMWASARRRLRMLSHARPRGCCSWDWGRWAAVCIGGSSRCRSTFGCRGAFVRLSRTRATEGIHRQLCTPMRPNCRELTATSSWMPSPGLSPLTRLVTAYLSRGIDVVSANKALIAQSGRHSRQLASRHGASLRYSATVGGSAR
jgi:hypothetical protein